MRAQANVSSGQVVLRSTKHRNIPTPLTHTLMKIKQEIFPTGAPSPQYLISSMQPSYTGVTIKKSKTYRSSYNAEK